MNLNDKSLAELVTLHNDLNPTSPIKKFRDKATAITRVEALLEVAEARPTGLSPNTDTELEAAVGAATRPTQRGYTFNAEPGEVSWPQEGCKRYRLAEHLLSLGKKGVTFEALYGWTEKQGFGWKRNDLADAIRLLIRKNGFGVTTTDVGDISVRVR